MIDPDIQRFVGAITASYGSHPDFGSLPLERRRAIAAATRAPWRDGGPQMDRISEGVTRGLGVGVRIYDPGGPGPRPAIAYMHGGGWTFFGVDTHDRLMREYAARTGAVVIGVDYSLAPESTFPRQIEEVVDVVDWLRDGGAAPRTDHRRIALAGDSAGATLAIAAALALRDAGGPGTVDALILNYGAFDADCTRASYGRFGDGSYLLSTAEMQWMWEQYLGVPENRTNPLACPLLAELAGLPPCFLVIAESDILHDENVSLADRLYAAGVPTRAVVYPGTVHGFLEAVAVARVSEMALDDTARWLGTIFDQ
jgi:acetyl esterase